MNYNPDQDEQIDILTRYKDGDSHTLTQEQWDWVQTFMPQSQPEQIGFYANLANHIDDSALNRIAIDICRWFLIDESTRKPWEERSERGLQLLGMSTKAIGGAKFDGASRVVHPLLIEACMQFSSRSIVELWPATGPVKTEILGGQNEQLKDQAERVQDYLNYLYTVKMPGGFDQFDKMLYRLPMEGSCFKIIEFDPILGCVTSKLIEPADFIAAYTTQDLLTAKRFTIRTRLDNNDIINLVNSGYYKDTEEADFGNERWDFPEVLSEIDNIDGKVANQVSEDMRHTVYKCYIMLDIPGFEHVDERGIPTGRKIPYIVHVARDTQRILRIERNWKPNDPLYLRDNNIAHHKFLPGLGFYGEGLTHLIGETAASATGSLRALLDAAMLSNMQGGFVTVDSKIDGGEKPMAPGEWRIVQSSYEDLQKAFFRIPYGQPSPVLFQLLSFLDERAQRMVGTTENMVGEANANAPVGTTLALIEQGSKQFTAIHMRLHQSLAEEYRILKRIVAEYIPDDGYPYIFGKKDAAVMKEDFSDYVNVIPVSDPNIISSTQRVAQCQAVLQLAGQFPQLYDLEEANRRILVAMRIDDIDSLLKPQQPDPVAQAKAELEVKELEAKIKKLIADSENVGASSISTNVKSLYEAMQVAQGVVTMPQLVALIDSISKSCGFVDKDGEGITGKIPEFVPEPIIQPDPQTNPLSPQSPNDAEMQQANMQPEQEPQSAQIGADNGILQEGVQ